jgi:hypothetical protein
VPTNDNSAGNPDYDYRRHEFPQANYDIGLVIDPTNPNIVYLGGKRDDPGVPALIRVDTTYLADAHAFYLDNDNPDGGLLRGSTGRPGGAGQRRHPADGGAVRVQPGELPGAEPAARPGGALGRRLDVLRDQHGAVRQHRGRLALGALRELPGRLQRHPPDAGDPRPADRADPADRRRRPRRLHRRRRGDGTLVRSIGDVADVGTPGGNTPVVNFSRNGNLQLTQHYYGASQPSELAALVAGALFYGQDQDTGFPRSTPTVLQTGDIRWNGAGGGRGDGSGVATDQTGSGTVYEYQWPCCGGEFTDFFRVNGVARTQGWSSSSSATSTRSGRS